MMVFQRGVNAALPTLAAGLMLGMTATATASDDEGYPNRPIELIVQSSAGSSSDVFARQLAQAAEPILGQPIAILLKPGGGGANQMSYISSAKPDGYTIGINTLTHFTGLAGNLSGTFSVEDFSWLAVVQEEPHLFAVRSDAPYDDFAELDEALSSSSDSINVGGYGPAGSAVNIATSLAMHGTDIDYDWIGFNASTEAITALLGGHLDVVALTPSNVLEFVEADRVKVLGVTTEERTDVLPDVPTLQEQGYETETSWQQIRAVYGPGGIPEDVQETLADALIEAANSEGFQEYMSQSGISTRLMGPEEYQQYAHGLMETASEGMAAAGLQ